MKLKTIRKHKNLYIDILKDGNIQEEWKEYILQDIKDKELSFYIFNFLKNHKEFIEYDILPQLTNIPKEALNYIFSGNYIVSKFPAVGENYCDIVKAYIIKLPFRIQKSSFVDIESLNTIKEFVYKIKEKDFEDFFVIFDKDFDGFSYELSLVSGLLAKNQNNIEDFAFSGRIDEDGNILPVDMIEKKSKICKQHNLYFINHEHFDNVFDMIDLVNNDYIDIPFVISTRDKDQTISNIVSISKLIRKDTLRYLKIYGITTDDIILITKDLPTDKEVWFNYLKELGDKIKHIYNSITNKKPIIHISNSIASFGILAGAMLGIKQNFIIYHFQGGSYYPVFRLLEESSRDIKQIKNTFSLIEIEDTIKDKTPKATLIIYLASHNPVADVVNFTKNQEFIYIKDKKYQGKIPIEENWSQYVSEIYSFINLMKEKHFVSKFDLFLSMPSSMALALGMTIGHFMDIDVYNYDSQNGYYLVGNTKDLKPIL